MRKTINEFISKLNNKNVFLLHPDIWHFKNRSENVINCGVIEQTIMDIAIGMSMQNKVVFVYGIAGFILYKCYETLKLYSEYCKGSIIILNAGANGCYPKSLGKGHQIDDDLELCKILKIDVSEPKNKQETIKTIKKLIKTKGIHLLRLGYDFT